MKVYYTITLDADPSLFETWVKQAKALGFKSLEEYIKHKVTRVLYDELPNE